MFCTLKVPIRNGKFVMIEAKKGNQDNESYGLSHDDAYPGDKQKDEGKYSQVYINEQAYDYRAKTNEIYDSEYGQSVPDSKYNQGASYINEQAYDYHDEKDETYNSEYDQTVPYLNEQTYYDNPVEDGQSNDSRGNQDDSRGSQNKHDKAPSTPNKAARNCRSEVAVWSAKGPTRGLLKVKVSNPIEVS